MRGWLNYILQRKSLVFSWKTRTLLICAEFARRGGVVRCRKETRQSSPRQRLSSATSIFRTHDERTRRCCKVCMRVFFFIIFFTLKPTYPSIHCILIGRQVFDQNVKILSCSVSGPSDGNCQKKNDKIKKPTEHVRKWVPLAEKRYDDGQRYDLHDFRQIWNNSSCHVLVVFSQTSLECESYRTALFAGLYFHHCKSRANSIHFLKSVSYLFKRLLIYRCMYIFLMYFVHIQFNSNEYIVSTVLCIFFSHLCFFRFWDLFCQIVFFIADFALITDALVRARDSSCSYFRHWWFVSLSDTVPPC